MFLNEVIMDGTAVSGAGNQWLLLLFYLSVFAFGLAFIPAAMAKSKGYNFGLWWLYGFVLFIVALVHINALPNKNQAQINKNELIAAETIKKYKELLDSGAITAEEFNEKKKEILGQ